MKNIKKILISFLLIFLLVSCSGKNDKNNTSNTKNNKTTKNTIKIGVSLYDSSDTFISVVKSQMDVKIKELKDSGVDLKVTYSDGQRQQANQNDQIDLFITQGFDAMAINLVDRTAASVVIEKAKKAGVPIVFFNREPVESDMDSWDKLYYVGARAEESGLIQADIIADYFEKNPGMDRNGNGKIDYVLLEGEPGHQDAILRTKAVKEGMAKHKLVVNELASDTGLWQRAIGQEKMSAWISAFQNDLELVIANNDDMALGAIEALKSAGYFKDDKFMPVVGVDATAPARDSIASGEMLGTVLNDAENQGKDTIGLAYALAENKDLKTFAAHLEGKYDFVPYTPVTK